MTSISNDEEFQYYYSHIRITCIEYLNIKFPNLLFSFDSFHDVSIGSNKRYDLTYSAYDHNNAKTYFVNLTVSEISGKLQVVNSNIHEKA